VDDGPDGPHGTDENTRPSEPVFDSWLFFHEASVRPSGLAFSSPEFAFSDTPPKKLLVDFGVAGIGVQREDAGYVGPAVIAQRRCDAAEARSSVETGAEIIPERDECRVLIDVSSCSNTVYSTRASERASEPCRACRAPGTRTPEPPLRSGPGPLYRRSDTPWCRRRWCTVVVCRGDERVASSVCNALNWSMVNCSSGFATAIVSSAEISMQLSSRV
jgi:hypothetical protein